MESKAVASGSPKSENAQVAVVATEYPQVGLGVPLKIDNSYKEEVD